MSATHDVRSLFTEYARGEISAESLRALETALRTDAPLRREFVEYMNVDSALGDMAALTDVDLSEIESASNHDSPQTQVARRSYRGVYLSAAVAFSLVLTAILWFTPSRDRNAPPMAMLVGEVDATLTRGGETWKNAEIPVGDYRLSQGLLRLQFAGDVIVHVEAPARFQIVDPRRIQLLSGRISANVPREGVGFTVETSEAKIVDYGTEFSVEAESGSSEVHVFEGLVRVQSLLGKNDQNQTMDLRTSQAVRIENTQQDPVSIHLANDRFIRNFDEPKRNYARTVKQHSPIAYYRMAIRDKGLLCDPPQYSGTVLTGEGNRLPHARGVFAGGSLRVGNHSTGRGGRVDIPPPLGTGHFTLAVYIFLESGSPGATVATNLRADGGNFALSLDDKGFLRATVRQSDGVLLSVSHVNLIPLATWRQLVVTSNGVQLQLYEDGRPVSSVPCSPLANSVSETVWFGTDAQGTRLWNGRIDELALFDRALDADDIASLYLAAQQEIAELGRE